MKRRPPRWVGIALLLWAGQGLAVQSTITEAEGYACMGDERSRKETEQAALADAKRNAAEHATTLIETKTEVEDLQLKEDLISAFSKAQVKLVKELERAWYEEPGAGDCVRIKIQAEVIPDTVVMEAVTGAQAGVGNPALPLQARIWTDKETYRIEEKIKIYVQGNKPSMPGSCTAIQAES